MKVGQARQSIFEVVDDIMNSLVLTGKKASNVSSSGPYGLTRSPEAQVREKPLMFQSLKKASNTANSDQINFPSDGKAGGRGPLSDSKETNGKEKLQNLLAPTLTNKLNRFAMRAFSQATGNEENKLVGDDPRRMSLQPNR